MYRRPLGQQIEHRHIGDVAGVDDHIGSLEMATEDGRDLVGSVGREMGVGDDEDPRDRPRSGTRGRHGHGVPQMGSLQPDGVAARPHDAHLASPTPSVACHTLVMAGSSRASKTCTVCGRTIEWRKKWERNWDEIRYCGEKCRRNPLTDLDRALERAIIDLLDRRAGGASICPSEAARLVDPDEWRALMPRTRSAARRLVSGGRVIITQRGATVDPSTAKGPVRIARTNGWPSHHTGA